MSHAPSPELLARFFAAETAVEERGMVEAWAAEAPENRQELDRLRAAWTAAAPRADWDVDRAWSRVAGEISAPAVLKFPERMNWRRRLLQVAAIVALFAGGRVVWRVTHPLAIVPTEVATTAVGEQRQVDLPDGTRVMLAAASTLRIVPGFGRDVRVVELTGEALFDVYHDATRPFEVRAAGAIVRDVGTQFSVRARAGDSVVRVVMVEGVASLRAAATPLEQAVRLNAQDVGTLVGGSAGVQVRHDVTVAALIAWRDGRIELDDVSVADAFAELSNWYGVVFRLSDPVIGTRRVTATLPTANLSEALKVLTLSLGLSAERVGDTVIVR